MNEIDLIGQRFGRLKAIQDTNKRGTRGDIIWLCQCDCGNITEVHSGDLRTGHTQSCGCLMRETSSKLAKRLGSAVGAINGRKGAEKQIKHGDSRQGKTPRFPKLYGVWGSMKSRCKNPNDWSYKNYGGRGIEVYDKWQESYQVFKDWALSHGYQVGLCLDRIDNDGDYCPKNCRWITRAENSAKEKRDKQRAIDQAFLVGVRLGLALGKKLTVQY